MKKKYQNSIRKHFFTICFAIMLCNIFCINANAQTPRIDFTYDAAGNRIMRSYSPMRLMDTTQYDPEAEKIAAQYGINVYPNPAGAGNMINVMVSSINGNTISGSATIFLLDNTGKILYKKSNASHNSQIDITPYSAGIYFIKVSISATSAGKEEHLYYRLVKPE